jgi:hypothetical protein
MFAEGKHPMNIVYRGKLNDRKFILYLESEIKTKVLRDYDRLRS